MRKAILCLAAAMALCAQQRQQFNDGDSHGDAPYLVEEGWMPLLNGHDLSGWHSQGSGRSDWFSTSGIVWDRLLGPTPDAALPPQSLLPSDWWWSVSIATSATPCTWALHPGGLACGYSSDTPPHD